jgi:uncharacterized FlaG/YvyC family protein
LYLFFQDNLTTTKNKDFYNNVPIEPKVEKKIEVNIEKNVEKINTGFKDLNTDFTYQMKYELNDFISKMKNEK